MTGPGSEHVEALVIGSGPAGLMAAEVLGTFGARVLIAESRPSPARKFLMAGKSGLNLTKDLPTGSFLEGFPASWRHPFMTDFGPSAVMEWARGLGQEIFTGTSGRVFPVAMKASPLLRAWLRRLASVNAVLRTGWRWTGLEGNAFQFDTADGLRLVVPQVTVIALGGASWPSLGSDGGWVPILGAKGVEISPLRPANMGFRVTWSHHMERHFGRPVKNVILSAGGISARGEFVVTAKGIEGGAVYAVSSAVRDGSELRLDLAPDQSEAQLRHRLAKAKATDSLANRLRKSIGLDPVKAALLMEWGASGGDLVAEAKSLRVAHDGPNPLAEAISTAGGIIRDALSTELELLSLPGVFAAGEMLDWEAPTGGYLITGCLATGRWAGRAAARRLSGGG